MIIFINGAFGAGKTTLAEYFVQNNENFMLFDPEEVGFMLRTIIPNHFKKDHERTGDFQDLDSWRILTVEVLKTLSEQYRCHFVVPMTLCNKEYCEYIIENASSITDKCYHFILEATQETIHSRLRKRGDEEGCWSFKQTERCISGFESIEDAIVVDTENKSTIEIHEYIKAYIGA